MDKKGNIHPHSEEKLSIYREYLEGYLSVLANPSKQIYETINIIELFAGSGISENEKSGSAVIAAKTIRKFYQKNAGRNMKLQFFLNEKSHEKCEALNESLSEYEFANITNIPADDFVCHLFENECLSAGKIRNSRSLVFIDPYGYTQLSQKNLNKLLQKKEVEILLFMPTNSIYRFKSKEGKPARNFILEFGIQEHLINDIKDIDSFAAELTKKLKERASTPYAYNYEIVNRNATNSKFHLFFVTRNIVGARKFLEAKNKISKALESQLSFFNIDRTKREDNLRAILSQRKSNTELYAEIIQHGYLPSEINPILKEMESSKALQIQAHSERKKGCFYLAKSPIKTIYMQVRNHE